MAWTPPATDQPASTTPNPQWTPPASDKPWAPPASDKPADDSWLGRAAAFVDPGPFIKAVPQGIIGIPEAIYQYAEHLAPNYVPHPGHWADPLRRYQKESESTWGGLAGETVGNVAGFVAGGEVADALGLANRARAVITSPAWRTWLSTIGQSQIAQPTQGDDFWTQKGESAFLAHLLGRIFGRGGQQAEHDVAVKTNADIDKENMAAIEATKKANREAATAHTQTVKTEAEQHKALSEAQEQFHQQQREPQVQAAQTETEQHRALSEAQQQFQQQQRDAAQRAADALSQRTEAALEARRGQIAAQREVPGSTTQGWWDRTLAQIGVRDPAVTRAGPATGAKVRDIVGGRLNRIMEDMHLDPNDPAFTQHINEIRDEVLKSLPKDEQAGWFHKPPEPELNPLLVHPTTGQPLERTTRGVREKAPEEPSGTFYSTVMAPLSKGPMTGRELTNYVSRIGARAEQLAKEAAQTPGPRRTVLQAQADALRNIEDAVIGHAAGTAEQKTALESARRAYFMWAIGNDAARASRGGIASPDQLISSMTRRMRGEARYEQAVNDPASPYHDTVNWLQAQRDAHKAPVPSEADVRRAQGRPPPIPPRTPTPIPPPAPRRIPPPKPTPIPPPAPRSAASPRLPPPPRPPVEVPPAPRRPGRSISRAAGEAGLATILATHGHPVGAFFTGRDALRNLIRHPQPEGRLEQAVREQLTREPRGKRAITAIGGTAAGQAPRVVPPKIRKAVEKAGSVLPNMYYRWAGQ